MLCKIKTDIGCRVYVDEVLQGVAEAKELFKIPLDKGQYLVRYESIYDSTDYIERVITMVDSDIVEYANMFPIVDRKKLILEPFKNEEGMWGYKELFSGKEMIEARFTDANRFTDHTYAIVKKGHGYGVINFLGETVLNCQYDWVAYLSNDWFVVKQDGEWRLYNPTESVEDPIDEWIEWQPMKKFVDVKKFEAIPGIIVINGKSSSAIFSSSDGEFKFVNKGSISQYIRGDGYIEFWKEKKVGLLDKKHQVLVPCRYDEIFAFKNGVARVRNRENGKDFFGVINEKGEAIVPCVYEEIRDFNEGLARAYRVDLDDESRKVYGFLNTKGFEAIPFIYQGAADFSDGLARVIRKDFRGFINTNGEEVLPVPWYTFLSDSIDSKFNGGLLRTIKGLDKTHHGFMNQQGEIVAPEDTYEYDSIVASDDRQPLFPGYRMVKKDGLYGFVNTYGDVAIPIKYTAICLPLAKKASEKGYITAFKDGKIGYLDRYGKEVLPFVYEDYSIEENDLAIATQSRKKALFSQSGSQITDFLYDDIIVFGDRAFVYKDEQVGVIDKQGGELVPFGLYKERHPGQWRHAWTQNVYYHNHPGFLLITNLRFYPSNEKQTHCRVDPESQILLFEEGASYVGDGSCFCVVDAETGHTIVPNILNTCSYRIKRTKNGYVLE